MKTFTRRSILFMMLMMIVVMSAKAVGVVQTLGSQSSTTGTNTLSSFTASAGNNRILIVTASDAQATSVTGVTFNGTSMVQAVVHTDGTAVDAIYYLVLGTSGSSTTGNIIMTDPQSSNHAQKVITAQVFQNVDQSSPVSGAIGVDNATIPSKDIRTISSAFGNVVFDLFDTWKTATPGSAHLFGAGQTSLSSITAFHLTTTGGYGWWSTTYKAGASSVSMRDSTTNHEALIHLALSIKYGASTNTAPTFTNSNPQALTICQNSGAASINTLLTVSDVNASQTETWTVTSSPSHGTLGGFNATASSGSASITPSGLTYTPTNGYSGSDAFTIQVSDGTATASMTVNVTVNAAPSVPTGTASQAFCSSSSPTVANLAATGSSIKWYDQASGGTLHAGTDALSSTHYYASQTTGGCESASRLDVTVTVNTTPSAPTGTASQAFCSASSPTVANLAATGSGIQWYDQASGGTLHAGTDALSDGVHYFASQTTSGCESSSRLDVTATVNTTPSAPTGTASQAFCSASSPVVTNLAASGSGIQWYDQASGGTLHAGADALSDGVHYYASQTTSGCESTTRLDVTATVNTTPSAPTGTASQAFCSVSSPTVANLAATGSSIQWYDQASGGTLHAGTDALSDGVHYYASQTTTGCESASRLDVTAAVNANPTPSISGILSYCSGSSATLDAGSYASYVWSTSETTESISATTAANPYSVTVTDGNGCSGSSSSASVTVNPLPQGSLSGNTIGSGGTGQLTFTSTSGANPLSLIISGQTYSTVTNGTPFNANPNPVSTTNYTLTSITDNNGCVRTSGITGGSATITLVPNTSLNVSSCNSTVSSLTDIIYCNGVTGATDYSFKFTNQANPSDSIVKLRGASYLGLSLLAVSGLKYNAVYNVVVKAKVGSNWGNYGTSCTLTTPAVPSNVLVPASCGMTATSFSNIINITAVPAATDYLFKFTNQTDATDTIVKLRGGPYTGLTLSEVSGLKYGVTYNVVVKVKSGSDWGSYGAACAVTMPAIPTTSLAPASCGIIATSFSNIINFTTVLGAADYSFKFTNQADATDTIIKLRGGPYNGLALSSVSGLKYEATYDVVVKVKSGSNWGSYGAACAVTMPALPSPTLVVASCGITVASFSSIINITAIPGATDYSFKFTNQADASDTVIKVRGVPYTGLVLNTVSGLKYETTYDVVVKAKIGSNWRNYGASCALTTPAIPSTSLAPASCGITVASFSSAINITAVAGASDYLFKFTNQADASDTIVKLRGVPYTGLVLNSVSGLKYEATYDVVVKVKSGSKWGSYGAACAVTMPALPSPTLVVASCGITVASFSSVINITAVPGATDYSFKFTNQSDPLDTVIKVRGVPYTGLVLNTVSGLKYETTYDVVVKAKIGSNWRNYGASCALTTPPIPSISLAPASCGVVLASFSSTINITAVQGASDYSFKFTNQADALDTIIKLRGGPYTSLILSTVSGLKYSATYDVVVKAKAGSNWGSYGVACAVTMPPVPSTALTVASCGITLTSFSNIINATAVSGATDYSFRFANQANPLDTIVKLRGGPYTGLVLSTVSGLKYNAVYDVVVKAKATGLWGSYGSSCSLTTPAIPATSLVPASCNTTAPSLSSIIYCTAVPFATNYSFKFTNQANSLDTVVKLRGSSNTGLTLSTVSGLKLGTAYDVVVKAFSGSWGTYDASCALTIASARLSHQQETTSTLMLNKETEISIYPNPFNESFSISSAADIQVKIYDQLGRLCEQVQTIANSEQQFGKTLKPGLYVVEVINGDLKTRVKILKSN